MKSRKQLVWLLYLVDVYCGSYSIHAHLYFTIKMIADIFLKIKISKTHKHR